MTVVTGVVVVALVVEVMVALSTHLGVQLKRFIHLSLIDGRRFNDALGRGQGLAGDIVLHLLHQTHAWAQGEPRRRWRR